MHTFPLPWSVFHAWHPLEAEAFDAAGHPESHIYFLLYRGEPIGGPGTLQLTALELPDAIESLTNAIEICGVNGTTGPTLTAMRHLLSTLKITGDNHV